MQKTDLYDNGIAPRSPNLDNKSESLSDILEDFLKQDATIAEEKGNHKRYSELFKKTIKRIKDSIKNRPSQYD